MTDLPGQEQLARVLGTDWQRMSYGKVADRAHALGRAADLTMRLARYMAATEAETAGEALERLHSNGREQRDDDGATV